VNGFGFQLLQLFCQELFQAAGASGEKFFHWEMGGMLICNLARIGILHGIPGERNSMTCCYHRIWEAAQGKLNIWRCALAGCTVWRRRIRPSTFSSYQRFRQRCEAVPVFLKPAQVSVRILFIRTLPREKSLPSRLFRPSLLPNNR
jgi:hypothetical protein